MPVKSELQQIPGVGPKIAQGIESLGIHTIAELKLHDPEEMYWQYCDVEGCPVDRCVLYVFRCAVYYARNKNHDPELLKWWNWKDRELG